MFTFLLKLRLLFKKAICLYVGKSDVLPMPLCKEDEYHLLVAMMNGDQKAKDVLIEHNLRLVIYVAKKYEGTTYGTLEDLISIGTIGLVKAIQTFNIEKNIKLATYASRCIENEILMNLRKTNKLKAEISLDEPLNTDGEGNELLLCDIIGTDEDIVMKEIEHNEQRKAMYIALSHLSKREKLIMNMRYGLDGQDEKTQKDVAEILGISQSYISRLEKKIIKKLRFQLNDENCRIN